ncbi:copper amine oxidase N-terminal domain-containing protein [Paenibacillus thalictri]|nr:copper amine oxidase N-terminal domain-containing protein [Paenibacillus thalictri]
MKIRFVAMLLIVVLIFSGCASLGELEPGKLAEKEFNLKSYEGKLTFGFEFEMDEKAVSELSSYEVKDLDIYRYLNGLKLSLTSIKVNNAAGGWSVKGFLEKGNLKIPFDFYSSGETAIVQIEGAKHPLVLDKGIANLVKVPRMVYNVPFIGLLSGYFTGETESDLTKLWQEFVKLNISNLPAPKGLTVRTNDNGYVGTQVAFSLDDAELKQLIKTHLRNVALDDPGLRKMAAVLYDYFAEQADDTPYSFKQLLEDKQMSSEGIYGVEKAILSYLALTWADESEARYLDGIRTDISLTADSNQVLRALEMQVTGANEPGMNQGVKSGKFTLSFQRGQIDQNVQPDLIEGKGSVMLYDLDTPERLLDQVDEKSDLFRYLKYELKLTKKSFSVSLDRKEDMASMLEIIKDSGESLEEAFPFGYISDNMAYAPVKMLAAKLGYASNMEETSDGTLTLQVGANKWTFKQDSKTALVNGQPVDMGGSVENIEGTLFVPVRFIVEQLGGNVIADPDTSYYIQVERD